jgi:ribosomal-protein-alanine acetyltransferase
MSTRLRLARREDAAVIAGMSRHLVEQGLPWSWKEQRILRCIANPECVVLTARDRKRLVGFAIMEFLDDRAHLNLIAVLPGYRKQGIGTRLLGWLEASARTAGTFLVSLELRVSNDAAHRFYKKLGYVTKGRRRAYYAGTEDALCMIRDLRMIPASPYSDSVPRNE